MFAGESGGLLNMESVVLLLVMCDDDDDDDNNNEFSCTGSI